MSLAELRRRAAVDKSETGKYAVRRWVTSVNRLYEEGDTALRLGSLENAYVYYMKGCCIMLDIIQQHPDYSSAQHDPFYLQLRKRTNNDIFTILEDIGGQLQSHYSNTSTNTTMDDQRVPTSKEDLDGQFDNVDDDLHQTLDRYPELSSTSLSALDGLPAVPDHAPSSKRLYRKVNVSDMSSEKTATPSPTSPNRHQTSSSQLPTSCNLDSATLSSQSDLSSTSLGHINVDKDSSSASYATLIQLPPRTNNVFPQVPQVEPRELAKWITRRDNPASILLLDVRPRDMFRQACIKHKWMVQIEPLVLRKNVSSHKIQDSLVLNPEAEQQLFEQRHLFDLVVFYDQNSPSATQLNTPLKYLKNAIYELEFTKTLPHLPMLLAGGFDAWLAAIGPRGVYSFNGKGSDVKEGEDVRSKEQLQGSPSGTVAQLQGVIQTMGRTPPYHEKTEIPQVHHTLYDYFNHKQRDGRLQSMSQAYQMAHYPHQISSQQQQQPYYPQHQYSGISMPTPTHMPSNHYHTPPPPATTIAQPRTTYDDDVTAFSSRYPDIRPNTSTANTSGLYRRNTFIDNPFHGFTATSNKLYDIPPIPAKPTRPLPAPPATASYTISPTRPSPSGSSSGIVASGPNIPPKPASLSSGNHPHASGTTNSRIAPVSDSSFSQLGGVLIGTTGLKNLGNTCYMNSIIQCLSGTIPFARYFISGVYKQHINKNNSLGTGGVLADSFAELIRVMWSENYNFISPVSFREALVRFAPQYAGTEQQDSQEFLNFLLDGLHEDLNAVQRSLPPADDATTEAMFEQLPDFQASGLAWEKYLARNASVIVSLFQGQYRSRLTCLTCKTTSTTYNTFMSLSLPIPQKRTKLSNGVTLYQCLDYFVKEEILEKGDAWHCPKCKKLRKTSKTLTLSRLPDVLLIHLKRFSFDGPFRNKLETNVDFPTKNLDLSRYIPKSMVPQNTTPILNYDLYAVSNHYGSLTGGHYTACVRNGYRGEWHNFDDTRFSICDESKVKGRAAYNLFYVRSTVK